MIYVNKEEVSEESFVSLLETTKNKINSDFDSKGVPKDIKGVDFEEIVYNEMNLASVDTVFHGHIEQTGLLTFPDIIARRLYGVEVKMTISDKWVSIGNSVLETTRVEDVETIYMFFGKFGKTFEAKYRKYQDCLSDVGVTHSPRYKIDMNLPAGDSIFDKIGIPYDVFRKEETPIKRLKEYYRRQLKSGEELWWIDPEVEEKSVSPIIQSFRLLDSETKDRYINDCMILFPEIFGNSSIKFDRPAAYLITDYNAVSSNLRDNFSGGGQMEIIIDKKTVVVAKIVYHLFTRSKDISNMIRKTDPDKLSYYWNKKIATDPVNIWCTLLKEYSEIALAAFTNGLKHG